MILLVVAIGIYLICMVGFKNIIDKKLVSDFEDNEDVMYVVENMSRTYTAILYVFSTLWPLVIILSLVKVAVNGTS